MEKLPYLKEFQQTNIPLVVTVVKRVGQYPETDFNTKQPTGRMQTLYNFRLPTGEVVRHYCKEREEEVLGLFSAGESVQVVRQEATNDNGNRYTFNVWTPVDGAEARSAANPPLMSNTRHTATQREIRATEEEREKKEIQICLQGFMQAFISSGQYGATENIDRVVDLAVKAREALLKKTSEIYHGIPTPTQETDLSEVPF